MDRLSRVVDQLGAPQYLDEKHGVALYAGDCLERMRSLQDGAFDLVVTSPPYNIGKAYEAPLALESYLAWCADWIREVYRVSADEGSFWLNLGYLSVDGKAKAIPIPYLLWDRIPFFLLQEIVWHYGAGVAARQTFSPRNEKFLWYVKNQDRYTFNLDAVRDPDVKYPNQKKNGKLKCNPLGKNPGDVWIVPKVTSGAGRSSAERTDHPAQFPVAVIERIILASSNAGDLVLDPFMGSGSTAEACLKLGRPVIGFEISPEYVDLSAARLERAALRIEEQRAQVPLLLAEQG